MHYEHECALCEQPINPRDGVIYDGEKCHRDCALKDMDMVGEK